jgi:4-amino-4-deoxychorismate lyase
MIIVNGKITDNVKVDSSFFFGRGIFETILVKEKPILLEKHIQRINKGAEDLHINKKISIDEVVALIRDFNIENTAMKIVLTEENVVITTRQIPYTKEQYERGFKITLSDVLRNSTSRLNFVKSVNYIENILEKEKAAQKGFNEVIFLNEKGKLTEGSCTNLFFIKDGEIFTPHLKCGLLDGIVRQWIIENFQVNQGEYDLENLYQADEIFLTNSLMGVMSVYSFNNNAYLQNKKTKKIQRKYFEFIGDNKLKLWNNV